MSIQNTTVAPLVLERPSQRRPILRYLSMLATLAAVVGLAWVWQSGVFARFLDNKEHTSLPVFEVDRGDLVEFIVENGSLESASNTIVRCEVEALMGMVGGTSTNGTTGTAGRTGTTSGSGQGTTSTVAGGGASNTGTAGGAQTTTATTAATAKTKARSGSTSKSSSSSSTSKSSVASSGSSSSSSSSSSASTSSSSSSTASTTTSTDGTTTVSKKPVIRSFTYMVTPHVPLRGASGKSTTTTAAKSGQTDQMGGGQRGGRGGGGGGGRGGRGGGSMMEEEKPGSTRIVSMLPEGSQVQKDQIVCELDASAFQDELKAQLIRHAQAKSWVDQARAIFEVTEITLREYRDGILPQDLQQIRQYIVTCNIEKEQADRNLKWTRDMAKKGLQTDSQVMAAELTYQQADIVLKEAEGMLYRLEKFTGPKNVKQLEAKVKAIESDRKNQEASFELEKQRLARLQKCIDGCTLRAPGDGILVYVQQTNGWGRVEQGIEQGVTVREGQPIFQLPDPRNMRVKAKINETKVSHLRPGQRAIVKVDAFPDRVLEGTVAEITAISTPINGPFSDVRIYYAIVNIDAGFDDLRPGLTAEVTIRTNARTDVPRLPIQSLRLQDGKYFVAVQSAPKTRGDGPSWRWTEVELGLSDPDYAEVISGVKQGDRILADPQAVPWPGSGSDLSGVTTVATVSPVR